MAVHAFSFLGERLAPMLQNRTTALTCCWENSGLEPNCEGHHFTVPVSPLIFVIPTVLAARNLLSRPQPTKLQRW